MALSQEHSSQGDNNQTDNYQAESSSPRQEHNQGGPYMFDKVCNFFGLPNRVCPDPATGELFFYQTNRPDQS